MILENIDVNKIITGTPSKLLSSEYDILKANYTNEGIARYTEVYKKLSFHELIDNIIYVIREPQNGLVFFDSLIENYMMCAFNQLDSLLDTFGNFMDENRSKMPDGQLAKYERVYGRLKELYDNTRGTRVYAQYIAESIDSEFEDNLSENMYKSFMGTDTYAIDNMFNMNDLAYKIIITYIPYIVPFVQTETVYGCIDKIANLCAITEDYPADMFKSYMSAIMCLNKVGTDKAYIDALNSANINMNYKNIIRALTKVSIDDELEKHATIEVEEGYHYKDKDLTMMEMFDDIVDNAEFIEGSNVSEEKKILDEVTQAVYSEAADIMTVEYMMYTGIELPASGYTIEGASNGIRFDEAYNLVLEKAAKSDKDMYYDGWNEKHDDNAGPDSNGKPHKEKDVVGKDADDKSNDEDSEKGDRPIRPSSGDPSNKPKEGVLTKIQTGAMDLEQKQLSLLADVGRGLTALKHAGKAVLTIPANFVKFAGSIKKGVDDWDDERRKKEMLKPGYRKKVFATLHALIQYGIAWNINVLLTPIVFFIRKLSSEKNERIRNEVIRHLTTEINICEERINDAASEGKKQEKYKLKRIKDELEAELTRVKTNSKYV